MDYQPHRTLELTSFALSYCTTAGVKRMAAPRPLPGGRGTPTSDRAQLHTRPRQCAAARDAHVTSLPASHLRLSTPMELHDYVVNRVAPDIVDAHHRLFIIKNFLPLAFLIALTWALAWPVPGRYLAEITVLGNVKIMQVCVCGGRGWACRQEQRNGKTGNKWCTHAQHTNTNTHCLHVFDSLSTLLPCRLCPWLLCS